MLIANQPLLRN